MIKSLLAPLLIFATCINAESESFQKEVIASVKEAKASAKSAQALQYLSEKLNQSAWTFDPAPTPEQITSMKPRLKAKALLPNAAPAYAPRWEVIQKQDAAGVCKPLSLPELRTTATLAASDCPSATPKPKAFLVDDSGLASLEQSPAQGEAQRGFIVVGNLEQLSQSQSDDYFSKPQTLTPSSGIQAIALKFLDFVPDDAAKPKFVKALRVQAGSLVAEVPIARFSSNACGKPEIDNTECLKTKSAKFCGCYDKPQVMSEGKATLADGTEIILVPGSGTFKVWKEKNGNRILKPTGLWASQSDWQKALTRAGTAFSDTHYTDVSKIAGRACPPNVFLDHNNMTATDRCLYYDAGSLPQRLDSDGATGAEGSDWLQSWSSGKSGKGISASYHEGNVKICADKGMRLPTLYETTVRTSPYYTMEIIATCLPTGDGGAVPLWADNMNGVPSEDMTRADSLTKTAWGVWTATAYACFTSAAEFPEQKSGSYTFFGTSGGAPYYHGIFPIRCVLP